MSASQPCTCPGIRSEKMKNWFVIQRRCNHSAFNGYHYTPSDYSTVACSGPGSHGSGCTMILRSKSKFVSSLPDGKL